MSERYPFVPELILCAVALHLLVMPLARHAGYISHSERLKHQFEERQRRRGRVENETVVQPTETTLSVPSFAPLVTSPVPADLVRDFAAERQPNLRQARVEPDEQGQALPLRVRQRGESIGFVLAERELDGWRALGAALAALKARQSKLILRVHVAPGVKSGPAMQRLSGFLIARGARFFFAEASESP